MPKKLNESKPLGQILDEEVFVTLEREQEDEDAPILYWIGNNETAGWRSLPTQNRGPKMIFEVFQEIAKDALYWDAMNNRGGSEGIGYWYQKNVNGRKPGTDTWEWSGNPPEIKRPNAAK